VRAEQVERRIWIDAAPAVVYEYFLDPARLVRWEGEAAEVDARVGGDYRVAISAHEWVSGRFLELVPARMLLFTWARTTADGLSTPTTTVEVTLTPQGLGTAVRILHFSAESAEPRKGGHVLEGLTLYDRHSEAEDGPLRCEWCGRPGQALPFHVQSPHGEVEFAEPVLCAICQGLIGYLHPHRSEQQQPPEVSLEEGLATKRPMSVDAQAAAAHARHSEVHEWAAGVVSRLLTERFIMEGRPRPSWAHGPGWVWPPVRRDPPDEEPEDPRTAQREPRS